jgi:hypothetical protein
MTIAERDAALWGTVQAELDRLKNENERYRLTLAAIRDCTLTGVDYGDWVQGVTTEALEGLMPECHKCGTFVHEGPCVQDNDGEAPASEGGETQ